MNHPYKEYFKKNKYLIFLEFSILDKKKELIKALFYLSFIKE